LASDRFTVTPFYSEVDGHGALSQDRLEA